MQIIRVCAVMMALVFGTWLMAGCEQQSPPSQPQQRQGQSQTQQPQPQSRPTPAVQQPQAAKAPEELRIGGSNVSFEGIPDAKQDTTLNFLLIVDQSGSMGEAVTDSEAAEYRKLVPNAGRGKVTRMDVAKVALRQFIESTPPDVNLGLAIFHDRNGIEELVPLGVKNREQLLAQVNSIQLWNGGTPLGNAIIAGTDRLMEQYKKQLGYGEYRLVVVTDGENTGGRSVPEGAAYAKRLGMPIYTIGFAMKGGRHELQAHSAWYRPASGVKQLAEALTETLVETPDAFDTVDPVPSNPATGK